MSYKVSYQDRRGAGIDRYFQDQDKLERCLNSLRRPANIFNLVTGSLIGSLDWDDTRRRWIWAYNPEG